MVCNVNIVYGNLKPENLDYVQKPQRNSTFMNSALVLLSFCSESDPYLIRIPIDQWIWMRDRIRKVYKSPPERGKSKLHALENMKFDWKPLLLTDVLKKTAFSDERKSLFLNCSLFQYYKKPGCETGSGFR
jgi:hypothetical protein